ncbi:phage terminase large subunit [Longimycelium tulufanense]|uniref:Phage terminase large subunit n=1 Tax=Longimycelium tulufanense TaxID=907463 RepID=A0A8J3CDE1_9PSEU|nr:terminase family protein [Longimycelium tulufanense]GGM77048.1 phage terminase large subunit [Longimycelium tulufanense]
MTTALSLDRITRTVSPKQIRSIVESQHAKLALWSGAVSSGKTIASLIAFLIALAAAPRTGLVVIVGRTLQTIERNILTPLQTPELFGALAKHVHHTTGATTATILGRQVHLIGASDARAEGRIRGATVALAYVDEVTLIPYSFWMMLLSRLRVDGARLLGTTNPDGPAHWLRTEFILRAAEVNMICWHFTLADNPSLAPAYTADLHAQYTGLWARRYITGEWCLAEGAVFDMFDPARHVVDLLPPIHRWIALGVDYGTTAPFAAVLLGLGRDANRHSRLYLTHEWRWDSKLQRRSLTDTEYSERLRGWLAGLEHPHVPGARGIRPEWTVVDPSAASFVQQLYRDGLTPTPADNAVLDGIRTVSSLLATRRLLIHRRCTGLLNELPSYCWDPDKAQRGEDTPIKVEDHSLDAMRYAIHTTEAVWRHQLQEAA